jgi:hypothetical protein
MKIEVRICECLTYSSFRPFAVSSSTEHIRLHLSYALLPSLLAHEQAFLEL